jgi:hypothetical protein
MKLVPWAEPIPECSTLRNRMTARNTMNIRNNRVLGEQINLISLIIFFEEFSSKLFNITEQYDYFGCNLII